MTSIYNQCPNATPLLDALNAYQVACLAGPIQYGKLIEVTSQNGHSTKFRVPVPGEYFSQTDVAELSQEFLEVYDSAVCTLASQVPPVVSVTPGDIDGQIFTTMLADDRLQGISSLRHDYTLTGWPNYWLFFVLLRIAAEPFMT